MKRVIPIIIAVVIAITSLSFNVSAVAEGVLVGTGLEWLSSIFGVYGGSKFSYSASHSDFDTLDEFKSIGDEIGYDTSGLGSYIDSAKAGTLSSDESSEVDKCTESVSQICMKWYLEKVLTMEGLSLDTSSTVPLVLDLTKYTSLTYFELSMLQNVVEAFNSSAEETGTSVTASNPFVYDGYYRTTTSISYNTYKGAINKAIALATGEDESNIFAQLAEDGTVSKTTSIYSDSAVSYFDEQGIYYQSADIFTGFDLFDAESSTSATEKSFMCYTYANGGYGYGALVHPYIVVDNNVYISKNAACQLHYGGSGSVYNYLVRFGNDKFGFYSSGVNVSMNHFGPSKPTTIDDEWFTRIWLDFSSGNMVVNVGDNRAAYDSLSKCYSARYTVTFDTTAEASSATSVDFAESTTTTGGTFWSYTAEGTVAIDENTDYFYNLTDSTDTISYSEIAAMQEQGTIIDSGYMMKGTDVITADENNYNSAVDAVLNLPVSLIEYAALTQAAEQGLTDEDLNPTVSFTTDIDPSTGVIANTDVAVGDDVISGSGAGEQDKDKDLVYVPTTSATNTGTTDLTGSLDISDVKYEIETPSVIVYKFPFSLPFDVYNIFNLLSASPQAPQFSIPLQSTELGINESIDIDLSEYDWIAEIVRWFVYVVFCIGIIKLTNNLIGRGG